MDNTQHKEKLFKKYYLTYRTRIYWYVYRKISSTEEAEDITADVFMKLFENFDAVYGRGGNGILAWLYTVARNSTIDMLRKSKRRKIQSIDDEGMEHVGKVFDDFVNDVVDQEQVELLSVAITVLDDVAKEILTLRYEEGLQFSEIADVVGKSEGACKMILYRGLEKVKDKLEEEGQL